MQEDDNPVKLVAESLTTSNARSDATQPSQGQEVTPTLPAPLTKHAEGATHSSETSADQAMPDVTISQLSDSRDKKTQYTEVDTAFATSGEKPPGWEAAKPLLSKDISPTDHLSNPLQRSSGMPGTAVHRAGFAVNGEDAVDTNTGDSIAQHTPTSSGRGRPRGRPGRPRGSGRGRGGGRAGKRKRNDDEDEDDDGDSGSSDEVTPVATMTKSGRSVQKPTSFVPPPPSPTTTNKRKRPYVRRNPESAVCKICLRGTSPSTNMIVFCDGCNAPYHRWCHQPPIEQAVVDEVDREWFCKQCESERVLPVPEDEVASFTSAAGASAEQRQKYFASLAPGMLVTLLTKATTLHPDLPVFDPDFKAKQPLMPAIMTNGEASHAMPPPPPQSRSSHSLPRPKPAEDPGKDVDPDSKYGPDTHPANYPRPGQGLMRTLPPERDDLHYLVEDDDKYGVFTHIYQSSPAAARKSGGGME